MFYTGACTTGLYLGEEYKPQDPKFVDYLLEQSCCGRRFRRAGCWHGHDRDRNLKVSGVQEKQFVAPPGVLNIRATYLDTLSIALNYHCAYTIYGALKSDGWIVKWIVRRRAASMLPW
jgi:hypothetical protein